MDQKWPNSDFQPQNSMSNTDLIHLKIIFYLCYWISWTIFIIAMVQLIHYWKTLFYKKWRFFCRIMCSFCSLCNPKQVQWKIIYWHQLFSQKWAFSRLSTTVLRNCGHTTQHSRLEWIWTKSLYLGKRPLKHDRGPLIGQENPCFEIPYIGSK